MPRRSGCLRPRCLHYIRPLPHAGCHRKERASYGIVRQARLKLWPSVVSRRPPVPSALIAKISADVGVWFGKGPVVLTTSKAIRWPSGDQLMTSA